MRKAYTFANEIDEGKGQAIPVNPSTGERYQMPGMGTMRFANLHRLATSRLFAARQHIQKLAIAQGLFVLAVSVVMWHSITKAEISLSSGWYRSSCKWSLLFLDRVQSEVHHAVSLAFKGEF